MHVSEVIRKECMQVRQRVSEVLMSRTPRSSHACIFFFFFVFFFVVTQVDGAADGAAFLLPPLSPVRAQPDA
jgi:hypothetical protein